MNQPVRIDGTIWLRTAPDQLLPQAAEELLDRLRAGSETDAQE